MGQNQKGVTTIEQWGIGRVIMKHKNWWRKFKNSMESSKISATHIKPIICLPNPQFEQDTQEETTSKDELENIKGLFRELYNITINILLMVF